MLSQHAHTLTNILIHTLHTHALDEVAFGDELERLQQLHASRQAALCLDCDLNDVGHHDFQILDTCLEAVEVIMPPEGRAVTAKYRVGKGVSEGHSSSCHLKGEHSNSKTKRLARVRSKGHSSSCHLKGEQSHSKTKRLARVQSEGHSSSCHLKGEQSHSKT